MSEDPLKYYRLAEGLAACLPTLSHTDVPALAEALEFTEKSRPRQSHADDVSIACRLSPDATALLATIALTLIRRAKEVV